MTAQIRMSDGSTENVTVFQAFSTQGFDLFTAYRPDGFSVYHQLSGARLVNVGGKFEITIRRAGEVIDANLASMMGARVAYIISKYGCLNKFDMKLEAKRESNKFD